MDFRLWSTIYFILIALLSVNLIMTGERPTKTLAWLLVLVFMPIIGPLLYFTFGVNRKQYGFINFQKRRRAKKYLVKADHYLRERLKTGEREIINSERQLRNVEQVNLNSDAFRASRNNDLLLLVDGEVTFRAILNALEKAEHFIHIQYYIFEEGELADRFAELMIRKAQAGVKVRFLYDGVGSIRLSRDYLERLRDNGIETECFFPLYVNRVMRWQINYRNHRKIVVVDGKTGFTGGINVSDKYIREQDELGVWHDHHVQLSGPAVWHLNAVFSIDWYYCSGKEDVLTEENFLDKGSSSTGKIAQVIASGPDSAIPSVLNQILAMINHAERYIYIINPYVVPDALIIKALEIAVRGGVDVRILLPSKSDSILVKWAMRSYLEELLRVGVKIMQYRPRFLHGKVILVDDVMASIGTANLDIRSLYQNYEINVLVYDRDFAQQVKEAFYRSCEEATEMVLTYYKNLSGINKLKYQFGKILSPLM
ncbi:MAG TPA: cardiolipin synthase [Saprospiraceae bacterium]|nr:cardiolipin synthase [Saprospiraceae bacterium]HRV87053.1 cardiolipin synthase [Saprospiraceae bacterium]